MVLETDLDQHCRRADCDGRKQHGGCFVAFTIMVMLLYVRLLSSHGNAARIIESVFIYIFTLGRIVIDVVVVTLIHLDSGYHRLGQ